MVDNLRGGDPGRPPQALSPSRPQPGPQEGGYLSLGKLIFLLFYLFCKLTFLTAIFALYVRFLQQKYNK